MHTNTAWVPTCFTKVPGYEECLGLSTGPIRGGIEIPCHASSYSATPPHTSTSGDSCRNPRSPRSSFEQDLQPINRTSTSLFPQSGSHLNLDYINSSDSLFDPDHSPIPSLLPTFGQCDDDQFVPTSSEPPTLARSLSSTSHSETAQTPPTVPSANFPYADLAPSSTPLALSRHLAFKCADCSRSFPSRSRLDHHLKTHESFKCTKGCLKRFTLEKDRRRHENTIHAAQNSQCEICGRKGRKDNIKRHMMTHEGERSSNAKIG